MKKAAACFGSILRPDTSYFLLRKRRQPYSLFHFIVVRSFLSKGRMSKLAMACSSLGRGVAHDSAPLRSPALRASHELPHRRSSALAGRAGSGNRAPAGASGSESSPSSPIEARTTRVFHPCIADFSSEAGANIAFSACRGGADVRSSPLQSAPI